jgi:2-polyprenyl-3-methyl-5-hydroxy-6-metoxy-1,4-benzoquinol methylase
LETYNEDAQVFNTREMEDFWNETATRFGEKNDYRSVLHPSSKGLLNWYTDFVQRHSLKQPLRKLTGVKVLEIGCGVGRWSSRLATNRSTVVGVDISRQMIKKAKSRIARKGLSADFVVASATRLPFASHSFDATLSVTVLQHIVELPLFRSAVSEILRTTKISGNIVLLEYNNARNENSSAQFPTVVHPYKEFFEGKRNARLTEVKGVDLSIFLKPLNRITKKHGKYKDQLEGQQPSLRYVISAAAFYFLVSVGCIFSLPLDLVFRNLFLNYSEHQIFVFQTTGESFAPK